VLETELKLYGTRILKMRYNKLHNKYILADILSAILVWVLFIVFRKAINNISIINEIEFFVFKPKYYLTFAFFPFTVLLIHYLSGFYIKIENCNRLGLILNTLLSSIIISLVVFMFLMLDDINISNNYYFVSLSTLFLVFFTTTLYLRTAVYNQILRLYKTKEWTINTLIVGHGPNAERIEKDLTKNSDRHSVVGFVSAENTRPTIAGEKICGHFNQISNIIEKNNIEEVIIALDNPDEQKLFSYINTLYKHNVEIRFTPRLYEILIGSARMGNAGFQPLVSITEVQMPNWQIAVKRLIDVIASAIMLIVLLPVFIYFAIAIKLNSKGSVFYLQERIGRYGKPFNIVKFRTMYVDAENGTPKLSSATDERVTSIGRILRMYRIDELPQFWNILKGEMSIVGPRPERKYYINQIIEDAPYYCLLYKIRPGLTSWGPIKIGYSDTIEKMIERLNYDIIYMENMSLLNDLRILILTSEILFKGKGV